MNKAKNEIKMEFQILRILSVGTNGEKKLEQCINVPTQVAAINWIQVNGEKGCEYTISEVYKV